VVGVARRVRLEDVREVAKECARFFAEKGRPVYFSIAFTAADEASSLFFTPIAPVEEGGRWVWVSFPPFDYEKLLVLLLTHPRVSEVEYDEEEGVVYAVFDAPRDALRRAGL
jgi:hypothetical protein